ncbi:hypothetical protein FQN57_002157 [Myotisia sp. PD_48]|nr:hypothetical protein FQN57_002157 [Myotisia sp. PD_48]
MKEDADQRTDIRGSIGKAVFDTGKAIYTSLHRVPVDDGNEKRYSDKRASIWDDIGNVDFHSLETLAELATNALIPGPIDDKDYIMERVIQIASSLPNSSLSGAALTDDLLAKLWKDLSHPPRSYIGEQYSYREADGSNNNIWQPRLGAAGSHYARSVRPQTMQPINRPDPGVLFDSLMAREKFEPHPSKISSMLFYLASVITHDSKDPSISKTSSYLDLSPLYGNNQEEQNKVRAFKDGRLKLDCFSSRSINGLPPGVGVLLIMFNRFHNYVVENLALINENGRFTKPNNGDGAAYAAYDNHLFQTGRLVTCGLYINCILKDYVRTILNINRVDSDWSLDPRDDDVKPILGERIGLSGGNQVSAEFNLVYRWHSCISERDAKWIRDLYRSVFPGKEPDQLAMPEFLRGLADFNKSLPEDPAQRSFGNLSRSPEGPFNDDELVKILSESIDDCAGSFNARGVPKLLRSIEVLGIKQCRAWNLATLNEFRSYFHLMPHKSFEDINSDPYIASQLAHFYDHPDNVELYPGLVVEQAKDKTVPGSGLCANFTISRAILSDAVALTRGDRFYTVDHTPKALTNWGYNECNFDLAVNHGHVFHKLFFRAFPHHFKPNSVYAHFPLVIPSENKEILSRLSISHKYSWDRPSRAPLPVMITSHLTCRQILGNKVDFKVTWGEAIEFLMRHETDRLPCGRNFMLSGDGPANTASRKLMHAALYIDNWQDDIKAFYRNITDKLLSEHSYKVGGAYQVDMVRDVINLAQVHFSASMFSLPLRTEDTPRGIYTDREMYKIMALVFVCIFFNADPAKFFAIRESARSATQQFGQYVMRNVELIQRAGFLIPIRNALQNNQSLPGYGSIMIEHLLAQNVSPEELVWTHILPTAGGMVANQGQLMSQCLDYYLSEEGFDHLAEIHRLSKLDTPEADDLLLHYFLEGARIGSAVAVYRDVVKQTQIQDGDRLLELKPGQRLICNLVSASMDPAIFPEPTRVNLSRDVESYIHLGYGPHECLGRAMCNVGLTTMLKAIGKLPNLRRAPGAQGHLKKVVGPGGIPRYMSEEHSNYTPFPSSMKIQWDREIPDM